MDALDAGIMRSLGVQPWAERRLGADERQPAALAKRFGVRPELVRERIARLEERGIIAAYEIYPNFRLLGHEQTTFHYRLAAENMKASAMEKATRFDGVVGVYGYLGPQLCVDICYRTEADKRRRLEVLGEYLGNRDAIAWIQRHPPPIDRDLDLLDWRIIQALRGDARRPLEQIADELNTSIRTVRRRFARLRDDGAVDVVPRLDPSRIEGMILAQMIVHLRPGARDTRREVEQELHDQLLMAMTPPDERLDAVGVLLVVPSIGALEANRRRAEAHAGVDTVWLMVPTSIRYDASWIDEIIEEKVAALQERIEVA